VPVVLRSSCSSCPCSVPACMAADRHTGNQTRRTRRPDDEHDGGTGGCFDSVAHRSVRSRAGGVQLVPAIVGTCRTGAGGGDGGNGFTRRNEGTETNGGARLMPPKAAESPTQPGCKPPWSPLRFASGLGGRSGSGPCCGCGRCQPRTTRTIDVNRLRSSPWLRSSV